MERELEEHLGYEKSGRTSESGENTVSKNYRTLDDILSKLGHGFKDVLAEKEFITANDLSELPLTLPRRAQIQSELASWFGDYYKNLNVLFTSNLSTNGMIMVNQSLAYSLVIEGAVPFWDSSLGNECFGVKTQTAVSFGDNNTD